MKQAGRTRALRGTGGANGGSTAAGGAGGRGGSLPGWRGRGGRHGRPAAAAQRRSSGAPPCGRGADGPRDSAPSVRDADAAARSIRVTATKQLHQHTFKPARRTPTSSRHASAMDRGRAHRSARCAIRESCRTLGFVVPRFVGRAGNFVAARGFNVFVGPITPTTNVRGMLLLR